VFSHIAIANARLAGIPPDRIINYWPEKKLVKWMKERKETNRDSRF